MFFEKFSNSESKAVRVPASHQHNKVCRLVGEEKKIESLKNKTRFHRPICTSIPQGDFLIKRSQPNN